MKTGDDEMGRYGGSMYFTGYRSAATWADMGLIGDRLSFTDDEVITKLGLGYIQDPSAECAMDTAIRYELLNAGQDGEISAKQILNHRTQLAALIEAGIVADGWYKDEEGEFQRDWVFDERFVRLHYNSISGSYGYKQTHFAAGLLEKEKELRLYKKYGLREGDYWYYGESFETIQAAKKYLAIRQQVIDAFVSAGKSETIWKTGKDYAGVRAALRQEANKIIAETPKFGPMFDTLLSREIEPEYEDDLIVQLGLGK